ncbi:putative two-component system response regulator [Actinoplanes missouriensis 431]|uniref:Putative two-component system response regulator n=1 Tax=Actinoplanes missouriensis (strain ATCC 14538 / DSM 43046 / CBS 188.64 / JCM 3121 / NBRC 102363 / NCIMB 12654 / NRRL B-3342 / UNCC 431) TaxID=512565 RepID=I0H5G8_ACTM4|nr:response regulator transcription factor [Actinoplanes missouriensis]BAL88255.1 putative two-component system response regulator [Actinoplanes missouriensis 431]
MVSRHAVAGGHLLVVVPQDELRRSLAERLTAEGHAVTAVATGAEAMARITAGHVDLIVVDIDIPDLYDLAGRRPVLTDRPPIICMTTCEALSTLLPEVGTEIEDYVTKPCRIPELLARVEVQLRQPVLRRGDLLLDEVTCQVWRGDRPIEVTAAEYRLLRHLLVHAGQVLSKEQLAQRVWGESRDVNTIERLVSRLRQKVDEAGPPLIHTKRGFGYRLG